MADSILVPQNTATTCGLSQASTSNEDSLTLPSDKSKIHPLLQKLHLTAFKLSGNRSKVEDYQMTLLKSSCNHGMNLRGNNIGVISKNGCVFALRDKLIPCHQL